MIWEVFSTEAVGAKRDELLAHGWEPFAVTRTTMWLRREKRYSVGEQGRVDPSTLCEACGEKLGHGHRDDCPRMPATLEPWTQPEVAA